VLIIDTGPLLSIADGDDRHHQACVHLIASQLGPLVTTPLVATEAGWLIRRQLSIAAEAAFYRSIGVGQLRVETLTATDWERIADLLEQYADLALDAADASVVAVAERLGLTSIATLDRRDFRVVRPKHCEVFDLLPDV
jgi:predicted nucleic acid-binding protein